MAGRRRNRNRRNSGPDPAPAPLGTRVWVSLSGVAGGSCVHIAPSAISDYAGRAGHTLWVDMESPGPNELRLLRDEFGFHPLSLDDVARQGQRAKVDEYPGYFFVVLFSPVAEELERLGELCELCLFVGSNYVVTCHTGEVPALLEARSRWESTAPELRQQVGFLLHVIADSVIDAFFPVVDAIEDRSNAMEIAVFNSSTPLDPRELLDLKRSLHVLRKAISPMREVFNTFLRRDHQIFSAATYPYFQDIYDHILRLLDVIDLERDMTTGTLEAQLGVISNRLNETMKRLTVVAVCVAVMGAVFGAWGMNFDEVPLHDLGTRGFALLCATTVGLVGVVLLVSRRLRVI